MSSPRAPIDLGRITAGRLDAKILVAVADAARARAIEHAITAAVVGASRVSCQPPVVRLRTRRRLLALGASGIAGRIAIVRVTAESARGLPRLVAAIREAGAAGVQLVWDGSAPARPLVERFLFRALEDARAAPAGPPVVLSTSTEPAFSLLVLVTSRERGPAQRRDRLR